LGLSGEVATELREFLKVIFDPNIDLFMSDEDIEAGDRGQARIAEELAGTSVGIVVVTRENQHRQWLNFEAGALSKAVKGEKSRVIPLLIDLAHGSELVGPLTNFQYIPWGREGVGKLVRSLNGFVKADEGVIEKRLNSEWGSFEEAVRTLLDEEPEPVEEKRPVEAILEELLELTRAIHRESPQFGGPRPTVGAEQPLFGLIPRDVDRLAKMRNDAMNMAAHHTLGGLGLTPGASSWDNESRRYIMRTREAAVSDDQAEEFRRRLEEFDVIGVLKTARAPGDEGGWE